MKMTIKELLTDIIEIGQKVRSTTTSRPSVLCISKILTTFNLYTGRPIGWVYQSTISEKVRQAMIKI